MKPVYRIRLSDGSRIWSYRRPTLRQAWRKVGEVWFEDGQAHYLPTPGVPEYEHPQGRNRWQGWADVIR